MASIINAALSGGLTTSADTSGVLQLQTASITAVTVDASQRLGIGTTSPAVKLDVVGASTTGLRLRSSSGASNGFNLYNDSTNDIAYLTNFYNGPMVFGTNNTERMRLDGSGNLGIGTSSPSSKLSVNGGSTQTVANFTSTSTAVFYALLNSGSQTFIGNDSTSGSFVVQTPSGGYSTKLTVDNAGGLKILNTIGVGNATPSTSGAGITFPATQSASSNANTLDDYEEGTWTPSDQSGAGLTFTVEVATYTKVGRAVSIQGAFTYPSTASGATAQFAGFPFNAANQIQMSLIYTDASVASFTYLSGSSTTVYPLTPGLNVTNATLSGKLVFFAGTYFV